MIDVFIVNTETVPGGEDFSFLPKLFRGVSLVPETTGETLPVGFRTIYPEVGTSTPFNRIRYL